MIYALNMNSGHIHRWDENQLRDRGMPDDCHELSDLTGEEIIPLLPLILRRMAEDADPYKPRRHG